MILKLILLGTVTWFGWWLIPIWLQIIHDAFADHEKTKASAHVFKGRLAERELNRPIPNVPLPFWANSPIREDGSRTDKFYKAIELRADSSSWRYRIAKVA